MMIARAIAIRNIAQLQVTSNIIRKLSSLVAIYNYYANIWFYCVGFMTIYL